MVNPKPHSKHIQIPWKRNFKPNPIAFNQIQYSYNEENQIFFEKKKSQKEKSYWSWKKGNYNFRNIWQLIISEKRTKLFIFWKGKTCSFDSIFSNSSLFKAPTLTVSMHFPATSITRTCSYHQRVPYSTKSFSNPQPVLYPTSEFIPIPLKSSPIPQIKHNPNPPSILRPHFAPKPLDFLSFDPSQKPTKFPEFSILPFTIQI